MTAVLGVLETALYVSELNRAKKFYVDVVGLTPMFEDERLVALDAGGRSTLLLFLRGESIHDRQIRGGLLPGHNGWGPLHMAFAISSESLSGWKEKLADAKVGLRGEMEWPAGGRSIYFNDPDGHLLELATPGIWPNFPAFGDVQGQGAPPEFR